MCINIIVCVLIICMWIYSTFESILHVPYKLFYLKINLCFICETEWVNSHVSSRIRDQKKGLELLSLPTWVLVTKHGSQEQYLLLTADTSLQPYFQICSRIKSQDCMKNFRKIYTTHTFWHTDTHLYKQFITWPDLGIVYILE